MSTVTRDFESEIKCFKEEIQRLRNTIKAKDEENKKIKDEKDALKKDLETKISDLNREKLMLSNAIKGKEGENEQIKNEKNALTKYLESKISDLDGEKLNLRVELEVKNAEIEKLKKKKDVINILCVFPEMAVGQRPIINLDFIDRINNENQLCTIKRQLISDSALREIVDNVKGDYINEFDILLIGLCDSSGHFSSKNPRGFRSPNSIDKLMNFHNFGGKILLLHDAMEYFDCFTRIIGGKTRAKNILSSSVKFIPSHHQLMTTPFGVGSQFSVAHTHQTFRFPNMKPVIAFEGVDEIYFQENLSERIALCEAGHSGTMSKYEQYLFYNIIYYLYKS